MTEHEDTTLGDPYYHDLLVERQTLALESIARSLEAMAEQRAMLAKFEAERFWT